MKNNKSQRIYFCNSSHFFFDIHWNILLASGCRGTEKRGRINTRYANKIPLNNRVASNNLDQVRSHGSEKWKRRDPLPVLAFFHQNNGFCC